MPALHIRDISDTLMKELKVGAAESGLTLKQYVVERLEQNGKSGRVADVPRKQEIPVAERGVDSGMRSIIAGKSCKHGTAKGNRCWQCGGLAKV